MTRMSVLTLSVALAAACGGGAQGTAGEAGGATGEAGAAPSIVRGESLIERGDFAAAAAVFEELAARGPDDARVHYYLGLCRDRTGDLEGAEAGYRRAIALDADLAEAHNNLGLLLLDGGDLEGAEAELATYLAQNPDESGAHYNLGLAAEARGDLGLARERYRKASELDGEDPDPVIALADLARREESFQEALALYRRARAVDPGDALAVLSEGQTLLDLGRADEAEDVLESLADMPGADAPTLATAGVLLARYERGDAAETLYRAAISRDAAWAEARFLLGNALARDGRYEEAAGEFERFLEIVGPEGEKAAAARERLDACRAKTGR